MYRCSFLFLKQSCSHTDANTFIKLPSEICSTGFVFPASFPWVPGWIWRKGARDRNEGAPASFCLAGILFHFERFQFWDEGDGGSSRYIFTRCQTQLCWSPKWAYVACLFSARNKTSVNSQNGFCAASQANQPLLWGRTMFCVVSTDYF